MDLRHAPFAGENQPSSSYVSSSIREASSLFSFDPAVIAAYARELSQAAQLGCKASAINSDDVVIVISSFGQKLQPLARRFMIHDHAGMAGTIADLAAQPHRNVYVGLQLMRATLKGNERGGLQDVQAVMGLAADLDADKGNGFDLSRFQIRPTVTVVTSREPALNRQPQWWFTRPVMPAEAAVMAWGLNNVVGDTDGATADVAHVWRVPGTLNWPNAAKLKRGRPLTPQEVELLDGEIGDAVDPDHFWKALEKALSVSDLQAAYEAAHPRTAAGEWPSEEPRVYSRHDATADGWDGTEHEKRRVATALHHVLADATDIWLKVGNALSRYARSSWGREAWDIWSRGGTFSGLTFKGSPKFDAKAQDVAWANFLKRDSDEAKAARGAKIGTVFWLAKVHGGAAYFAAIKPFGKPPKAKLEHSDDVKAVLAAGAAIPTGKHRVMARIAHTKHLLLTSKSSMLCRMLVVVSDYLNREKHVGWAGFHRLAQNMSYAEPCSVEYVRKLMRELQALGYITMAAGTGKNIAGKRGPTYTLTPPLGFTWESLIAWNRDMVGHDERSAWDFQGLSNNPSDTPVGDHIDNLVDRTPASPDNPSNVSANDHIDGLSTRQSARGRPHPSTDGGAIGEEEREQWNPGDLSAGHGHELVAGTPEADRALIRHWLQPKMLPPEASRLADAMRTASMMPSKLPHGRHARQVAANVAKLLGELLTLGYAADRLRRDLRQHDLDLDGGRRSFKPKAGTLRDWKRANGGQAISEADVGVITYLASSSDKLTAIANHLSKYAPRA